MGGAGIATLGAFLGAGMAAMHGSTAVGITGFVCAALVSGVAWCVAAATIRGGALAPGPSRGRHQRPH